MKILITGHEGFVGQHLWGELQDAGHLLDGMDILNGPDGDVRDPDNLRRAIRNHKAEVVIHLARTRHTEFGADAIDSVVADSAGMGSVVAKVCGETESRLVVASSSAVYGTSSEPNEEDGPTRPRTEEGLLDLWNEQFGKVFAPQNFTSLRFHLIYGPRSQPNEISTYVAAARDGGAFNVASSEPASWCWVSDAARAIRLVIEKTLGGSFNIGRSDVPVPLSAIAELACSLAGVNKRLAIIEQTRASSLGAINNARLRSLGWEPTVSLYDGMQAMLEQLELEPKKKAAVV